MARFAPVAPPRVLSQLLAYSTISRINYFGNYHLLLAHDVVDKAKEYQAIFNEYLTRYQNAKLTIIMDNSLVECGYAVDNGMVSDAVGIMNQVIYGSGYKRGDIYPVLADVLGEGQASYESSVDCGYQWLNDPVLSKCYWMYVAQGSTERESCESVNNMMYSKHETLLRKLGLLSVPRVVTQKCGSRVKATQYASIFKPVHLLGFSDDAYDDIAACRYAVSIDSAVPLRCNDIWTPDTKMPPRGDWWEKGTVDITNVASNLRNVDKLTTGNTLKY